MIQIVPVKRHFKWPLILVETNQKQFKYLEVKNQ